jgi:spermidine synthase
MYIFEEANSSNVKSMYPIKSVLWNGNTAFTNNLIIANSEEFGRMLFTDGELQSSSEDEKIYHEYLIHPSLSIYYGLYNNHNLNILILGGGEGATTRELLKYSKNIINKIIWIDIDKDLVSLSRLYLKYCDEYVYNDSRVFISYEDANNFLTCSKEKFDIIICDLPDPSLNDKEGLYSIKFWNDLKKLTKSEHIITTHLGPISPGKKHFELCKSVLKKLNLNKVNYKLGKVFIPSFMSEWLYLYFSFNRSLKDIKLNSIILPDNLSIIDKKNINNFFYFPKYYESEDII